MLDERRITFGGEVIPAYVASAPKIIKPVRKMTVTKIAGSNREVVDMEDAWECYDQPYSMFIGDGSENCTEEALMEVARVLYKSGWQTLIDDYETDCYRLAYYQGGLDSENRYTRLAKFDISFRCRPERFLIAGNVPVSLSTGENILNPTAYNAKPLIHLVGSGNGTLTVNGTTMSFTGITDYLNLDCERQNCYRLPSENKNNLMTGSYPVLKTGENLVTFTGGITGVTITPKWYRI